MSISIGKRILLGFVAVTLVIVALGLYAIGQIGAVRDTTDAIVSRDLMMARQFDDLANKARDMGLMRRNAVISVLARRTDAQEINRALEGWRGAAGEADAIFTSLIRSAESYS